MTRVIVHAGYHKTGTTSLQDFMHDNRDLLKDYLRYFGKGDLGGAGACARIYAQRPFPWRLARFRLTIRKFLSDVPDGQTILISRESFSGGMPGHRRIGGGLITSYFGPALKIARVIISEIRRRFGADTEITFFYTIRDREVWIRSVHGHLLRSIRLKDDFDTFRARFPALTGPAEEAIRMRGALSPIPVMVAALEDFADHREGPAAAVLDFVGIPAETQSRLLPAKRGNSGQNMDLRDAFLRLNRRFSDRKALKAAKVKLMEEGRPNA